MGKGQRPLAPAAEEERPLLRHEPVPVLLLGTFHFANPGRDMFNVEVDDVLTARRQGELQRVIETLARFRPTKIAVEWPADDLSLVQRLHQFLAGTLPADPSEIVQIGFRLAGHLGQTTVYGVDVGGVFYDGRIDDLVARPPHQHRWERLLRESERDVTEQTEWIRDHDLGEALRRVNEPRALDSSLRWYLDGLVPIAEGNSYPGPDMVSNWYQRNMRIAANIHRLIGPGERILVLYGAGHIPVLAHLLGASSSFLLEDPLWFL